MTKKEVAIIGGGPAGLMAAERIAMAGHAVTVFERKPTPARKFLMAGRGGLNLTHSEDMAAFVQRYGAAAPQMAPLVGAFTPQDLRDWCEGLDQKTFIGSSGRVFPEAMKASPLLRAWRARLQDLGVELKLSHDWRGWAENGDLAIADGSGQMLYLKPDATVLALGGASWPRLGSDGGWVDVLRGRGVAVADLTPANSGFSIAWSDYLRERFAGAPLKPVALCHDGKRVQGEAMIAQGGIEGGAVYALSAPIRDAIAKEGQTTVTLDLRPNVPVAEIAARLSRPRQAKSFANFLRRDLNLSPLAISLLHESGEDIRAWPPERLAAHIKAVPLVLSGVPPIDRAISSAGGVLWREVDEGLMLRRLPGVFIAGEMLDWEAPTGGYLLQGCFATAVAAAKGAIKWLE